MQTEPLLIKKTNHLTDFSSSPKIVSILILLDYVLKSSITW